MSRTHRGSGKTETLGHLVHWTLLGGVVASGLLLVLGSVFDPNHGRVLRGGKVHAISELLRGALQWDGVSLVNLGLLTLMATPLLRIAVLACGWFAEGQLKFAAVSLVVLLLLILSMVLGLG